MGDSGALRPPTWTRRSGGTGGHSAGTGCPSGLLIWCPREAASRGPRGEVEWAPWLEENIASVFGVVGRLGSGCEVLIRERCRADAGARLQPRQGLGRGGPSTGFSRLPVRLGVEVGTGLGAWRVASVPQGSHVPFAHFIVCTRCSRWVT